MTTLTYNLASRSLCGGRAEFEQDYSIHLNGFISRDELANSFRELNHIVRRLGGRFEVWLWLLAILAPTIGFMIWIFVWTAKASDTSTSSSFDMTSFWVIWAVFTGGILIISCGLVFWRRSRLNAVRRDLQNHIMFLNAQFANRNVNWRLRTCDLSGGYGYGYGLNGRRRGYNLSIEIEIAGVRVPYNAPVPEGYQPAYQAGYAPHMAPVYGVQTV